MVRATDRGVVFVVHVWRSWRWYDPIFSSTVGGTRIQSLQGEVWPAERRHRRHILNDSINSSVGLYLAKAAHSMLVPECR